MGMRRRLGLIALCLMTLTSGCTFALPIASPRPPRLAGDQESMRQAAEQFLPQGAQLTSPDEPRGSGSFALTDVDGDGAQETLVFFRDEAGVKVGIVVLKKVDGVWQSAGSVSEPGRGIKCARVADVTGDGIPELLAGFSGGPATPSQLSVYQRQDGKFSDLGTVAYDYMSVGDADGDGVAELAVQASVPSEFPEASTAIYRFTGGQMTRIADARLPGWPMAVTIGQAAPGRSGVFVDIGLGAHSAGTQLYFLERQSLRPVFPEGDAALFKAYPVLCTDVDGDGIVEVGTMVEPPGSERLPMVDIPWIQTWQRWDGKTGLTAPVCERYAAYNTGYQFVIPNRWRGAYTATRPKDSDREAITFLYIGADGQQRVPLFTLSPIARTAWDAEEARLRNAKTRYLVLGTGNGWVYVAIFPDAASLPASPDQNYVNLQLKEDEMRHLFSVLPQ